MKSDMGTPSRAIPPKRGETLLFLWTASTALMPKCPLCLYALLGATGAAGAAYAAWMPVVLIVSLLVSVGALWIRSRMERRYGPAIVASIVAITIVVGKFVFQSTTIVYAGAAALFAVAVFNFTIERLRWHKPLPF
jgi:hypothetical protein